MTPKFKYGDIVKTKDEFYDGLTGTVIDKKNFFTTVFCFGTEMTEISTTSYLVKFKFNDLWFDELDLEKSNDSY